MSSLLIKGSCINKAGLGLYTKIPIKKGTVILTFSVDAFLISKEDYDKQQKDNNKLMVQTGCRFLGDIFLYTDARTRYENYINHSFTPNVLYHCGICIAKNDIAEDDELTIDYRYILSDNDDECFVDNTTGQQVIGYDGITALKRSSIELLELLNSGVVSIK